MKNIEVSTNDQGQRLDRFLRKYLPKAPLSTIYKIIRKDLKVNGKRVKQEYNLNAGDVISLYLSEETISSYCKEERRRKTAFRQFSIAYEDDNILIANKPWGLLTHGDQNEKKNHLANQVVDYLIETGAYVPRIEKSFVPAPVNRLDRNTTGLVLFGKNAQALRELNRAIRERDAIEKVYWTIVSGCLKDDLALQDEMVKDKSKNLVSLTNTGGKLMETWVKPLQSSTRETLVQVKIRTGRTHQIRVQLAAAGYPLLGDVKYGNKQVNNWAKRELSLTTQLLHARMLKFVGLKDKLAYLNGKEVECQVPENFKIILDRLFEE